MSESAQPAARAARLLADLADATDPQSDGDQLASLIGQYLGRDRAGLTELQKVLRDQARAVSRELVADLAADSRATATVPEVSTRHAVRLAIARLQADGYQLEADDFFAVLVMRDGTELSPDALSPSQRQDLALIRADVEANAEECAHLPRHDVAQDVLRRGGDQPLADALAQIHADLRKGNMPGLDAEDLDVLMGDDMDHAAGFLDDIEARLGVAVDGAREILHLNNGATP